MFLKLFDAFGDFVVTNPLEGYLLLMVFIAVGGLLLGLVFRLISKFSDRCRLLKEIKAGDKLLSHLISSFGDIVDVTWKMNGDGIVKFEKNVFLDMPTNGMWSLIFSDGSTKNLDTYHYSYRVIDFQEDELKIAVHELDCFERGEVSVSFGVWQQL